MIIVGEKYQTLSSEIIARRESKLYIRLPGVLGMEEQHLQETEP
jgi:hypothetical protein